MWSWSKFCERCDGNSALPTASGTRISPPGHNLSVGTHQRFPSDCWDALPDDDIAIIQPSDIQVLLLGILRRILSERLPGSSVTLEISLDATFVIGSLPYYHLAVYGKKILQTLSNGFTLAKKTVTISVWARFLAASQVFCLDGSLSLALLKWSYVLYKAVCLLL